MNHSPSALSSLVRSVKSPKASYSLLSVLSCLCTASSLVTRSPCALLAYKPPFASHSSVFAANHRERHAEYRYIHTFRIRHNSLFSNRDMSTISADNAASGSVCASTERALPTDELVLDKSTFTRTLPLVALRVPAKQCSQYLSQFRDFLFDRPRFKRIYEAPEGSATHKLLLLHESLTNTDALRERLPPTLIDFHLAQNKALLASSTATAAAHTDSAASPVGAEEITLESTCTIFPLVLSYEHFSADDVLRSLLGERVSEVPSAFEQAGHIAHMNLRDEALPYKRIIGQVILDKNPNIRTVVNKVGNIETEFRTFPLEVIAGDADFEVNLKESGAVFQFDFSAVYWNSRLQMEHSRLIQTIRDDAIVTDASSADKKKPLIVADMMAGVGPFAVPIAMTNLPSFARDVETLREKEKKKSKKKTSEGEPAAAENKAETAGVQRRTIQVHANDLNPASYKYLVKNSKNNNCTKFLTPYNEDGRKFLIDTVEERGILPHHAIMNLPQNAVDFLDAFIGLKKRYQRFLDKRTTADVEAEAEAFFSPIIHVYAFSTHPEDPVGDIVERSASVLQCRAEDVRNSGFCEGHIVRDVAPKKVMIRLSFKLPLCVAEAEPLNEFGIFCFVKKKRSAAEMLSGESECEREGEAPLEKK